MKKYLNLMLLLTAIIMQASENSDQTEKLLEIRTALWFNHIRSIIQETIEETKAKPHLVAQLPTIKQRLLSEIAGNSLKTYRKDIEHFNVLTTALAKLQQPSALLPQQLREHFQTKEEAIEYFQKETEKLSDHLCTRNLSDTETEILQHFEQILNGTNSEQAEKLFTIMQRIQNPEFHNLYPTIESLKLPPL